MSYSFECISQNDHGFWYTKAIINRKIENDYFFDRKSQLNDGQYLARHALHYGSNISKLRLNRDLSFTNLTTYL